MRHLRAVIYFLTIPAFIYAQPAKTGYSLRIKMAKSDTAKANIYCEALKHFYGKNIDSQKYYTGQGLKYFREGNSQMGEGIIIFQLALIDRTEGRLNIAQQRLKFALEIFRKAKYTPGIADVLGNIGSIEASNGNYDVAAKYITESLKMEEKAGRLHGVMVGYMNLCSMYLQQNDTSNAEHFLDMAFLVSKQLPVSDQTIGLYNMKGILYAIKGNQDSALACFQHNLELTSDSSFVGSRVECLSYLGQYYFENGQPEKAIMCLNDGLKLAEANNLQEMRSNILLTMAALTQDSDPVVTMKYLDEALGIAKEMNNRSFMAAIYGAQASYFKDLGKFKEALFATEQKQKITDSIFSINKSIELSSISATYELEKSNLRVQDLEILSRRNAAQRNILLIVAAGVLFLLIILAAFFRKTILLNRKLKERETELKELNTMKDKLFSIIGHDLRGPISRIPGILDFYEDPGTSEEEKQYLMKSLREHTKASVDMLEKLLFWGQSLVRGIRMAVQKVAIRETIGQNISVKKLALDEKRITVTQNIPIDLQALCDATHFDFIMRNLLTNAIKYSQPEGSIVFESDITTKPGFVVISIKDNGTGVSEDLLPKIFNALHSVPGTGDEKGTGIGLMLCKEFAELNGGSIWVESERGKGATFFVAVKSAVA